MKQKQTYMRAGSTRSPEGTRLLFSGCTVSPMTCHADWWTKEGRPKRPDGRQTKNEGGDKAEKSKSRPQRGGGFSLILDLPGVSRWSHVCDIAWYIVIVHHTSYHAISKYTAFRDIDFKCRIFGTDMRISYTVEIFLDTKHYFLPVRCTKLGAPR